MQDRRNTVFLDSAMQIGTYGDTSFLACDPFLTMTAKNGRIRLSGCIEDDICGDPFAVLADLAGRYRQDPVEAPFALHGGIIGCFSYDLCHHLERLPVTTTDDIDGPDLAVGFYDTVLAWCHTTGEAYVCSTGLPEEGAARKQRARQRAEELVALVQRPPAPREAGPASSGELERNFEPTAYVQAVGQVVEYIAAGDIFQANLSQRFATRLQVSPWELYLRLRERNPAPFAAWLDFDDLQVVCASPERFLRVSNRRVETRPIKGTRPRGDTPEEDRRQAQELLSSEKDNAELMMIVDLERNDLGRVCEFGSVRVPELVVLESYPTVHHLVATVEGRLREGSDELDLLRATFPGGSITGAPKIRAMQIIDELEPTRRNIYTGCIGYLGFDGEMDVNIVIRTIICRRDAESGDWRAFFQVGGGIVADSQPEAEYRETLDKGRALSCALDIPPAEFER